MQSGEEGPGEGKTCVGVERFPAYIHHNVAVGAIVQERKGPMKVERKEGK